MAVPTQSQLACANKRHTFRYFSKTLFGFLEPQNVKILNSNFYGLKLACSSDFLKIIQLQFNKFIIPYFTNTL